MGRRGRGGRGRNHQHRNNQQQGGPQHQGGQNHGQHRQERATEPKPSQGSGGGSPGKASFPSIVQPRRAISRASQNSGVAPHDTSKKYHVVFFDTLNQARADLENLRRLAAQCDQLNIVVRAEASMDDPDLNQVGKLFCGAAWALVHERRRGDGWYQETAQ